MTERAGAKGAILMIHGVCCTGEVWSRMAGPFRDIGWRVETPTLRPLLRVKTDPPAGLAKVTLADYIADMAAEARRLEAETGRLPVVFGHSLGAIIAQKLAEQGVVRAIVLIAPAAPAGLKVMPELAWLTPLFVWGNFLFSGNLENKAIKVWKTGVSWGMLNCVPRSRHTEIYATIRYDSGRAGRDVLLPSKDPLRAAHIDETRVVAPVLTIGATKDRTMPIGIQRKIAEKYMRVGGDYLEYADSAHWILDEPGTDRVIADIVSWLDAKVIQ
jgi:pimeloyl-ACP methyl ester carboxylesterase